MTPTLLSISFFLLVQHVCAYIPAQPTNDTTSIDPASVGMLTLRWPPLGMYSEQVSYQSRGNASTGLNQGAIVHFTDEYKYLVNISTPTPWIALINCDNFAGNDTSPVGYDVISSANDQGAVAALLYSSTSQACTVNPQYKEEFNQVMDIYTTMRSSAARLIESQFSNVNASYFWYNASRLDAAQPAVKSFISNDGSNMNRAPGYLMATLSTANATTTAGDPTPDESASPAPSQSAVPGSSGGTGLAMIILYSITGCVSALFIIVILSGAIRAVRHPERYGPRAGNPNNLGGPGAQPQSRTGGLGRAIIDTFPIIKFGRTSEETAVSGAGATTGRVKDAGDLEGNAVGEGTRMEMRPMERNVSGEEEEEINVAPTHMDNAVEEGAVGATALGAAAAVATHSPHSSPDRSPSPSLPASTSIAKPASRSNDVVPEAIGRETCPICIVDFEVGDDLRVLPCPGKHRFHQECVDPWLLELSSSCPICRQDFAALQTMVSGADPSAEAPPTTSSSNPSRFSKYVRFAQRRRSRVARQALAAPEHEEEVGRAGSGATTPVPSSSEPTSST